MRLVSFLLSFATLLFASSSCKTVGSQSEMSSMQGGTPERADEIYRAVRGAMEAKYPNEVGKAWSYGAMTLAPDWIIENPADIWGKSAEELPALIDCDRNDVRCDKKFLRLSCGSDSDCPVVGTKCLPLEAAVARYGDAPKNMCLASSDQLLNRFYRTMVSANYELDIASLSMPNGRFETATINALAFLTQKPDVPKVRLFFSGADAGKLNDLNPPKYHLDRWIGLLKETLKENGYNPNDAEKMSIDIGWLSNNRITDIRQLFSRFGDFLSWNHAKIIAADGQRALVGGHNMWDGDYLQPISIFDLSMEYGGTSVVGAVEFLNLLWKIDRVRYAVYPESRRNNTPGGNGQLLPAFRLAPRRSETGHVKAIGVGRLGVFGVNVSDDALNELIRSAKHKVYIFQQDLYNQAKVGLAKTFVMDSIVATAARGVQITIVQSNKGSFGGYGTVEPASTYRGVLDEAVKVFRRAGDSKGAAQKRACDRITYAPFRFTAGMSRWPINNQAPIGTHSKLVMVDSAAFYIGSHNLYNANLQEFGNIVTDADATGQLEEQYWNKLWRASEPSVLPCPF